MNISCLVLTSPKDKKRFKSLQDKYNSHEDILKQAIYTWKAANEKIVKKDGGIDIHRTDLEDYLDKYFKIKSDFVVSEKEYAKLHNIWEKGQRKVEWRTQSKAQQRYEELISRFGEENVIKYSTSEGNIIVKAAEPINKKTIKTSQSKDTQEQSKVDTFKGNWNRKDVSNDTETLYIFTDNTDRDSGRGLISDNSWYAKKYGKGHHFPTMTTAVIRGLNNARPISTQRWYHEGAKGITGRWTDNAFEEFKKIIDDEFDEIIKEWNTGKYKRMMFPDKDGLFNTHISNISKERVPKIYDYLQKKYNELLNIVNSNKTKSKTQEAFDKLNEVRTFFKSRVVLDPDTHVYTIYDSEEDKKNGTDGHKAISISRYIYGNKTIGSWGIPSSAIGNTNDVVIRDYFTKNLKTEYPNLTKSQLNRLITSIKDLEQHLKSIHGENCIIITEEFPIAGKYTVMEKGKPRTKYLAGTMDMIIIDEEGNYFAYDMKAKRSGVSNSDKVNYGNQLGLYGSIFKPYGIEFKDTRIIHSETWYDGPSDAEFGAGNAQYEKDENGQLYDTSSGKKVPIQKIPEYNAPVIALTELGELRQDTLIPVKLDKKNDKMTIELDALSEVDRELVEEEFGSKLTTEASSMSYGERKTSSKSGIYNPILSATERKFLANQVMQQLSYIITHLQTSTEANNSEYGYFPDGRFASSDFTSMSREKIIEIVGVGNLFRLVKEKVFAEALFYTTDEDIAAKLTVAYDYFDDLVNEGYSKLITLEGVTVVQTAEKDNIILDTGDENIPEDNEPSTLEEKEIEYWQLGQRQISAKSSLSKEIRRMFERLKVLDKEGNPVKDEFGFGLDTFVDANTAVNNILDWCKNCTTIEEMEEILVQNSEAYPFLNTILEKIKEEPIRSLFFKNFRKDFTEYSVVRSEYDENGKLVYSVYKINTKGAAKTIMQNLATAFKAGAMQKLIITKDDVEGKGRVNIKNVEALLEDVNAVYSRLSEAFKNKSSKKGSFSKTLSKEAANITTILNKLGINVLAKTVEITIKEDVKAPNKGSATSLKMLSKARFILETLQNNKDRTDYNPMLKEEKKGNIYSEYNNIASILEKNIEESIEASTYENGKMYYSFVTPSYMGKLITNLKDAINNKDKFHQFIKNNYQKYRWFYNNDKNINDADRWQNTWLDEIVRNNKRDILEHKVQLNFGKTPYNELSEVGYTLSLMHEYFYDNKKNTAWYRLPILSNKPSSEFVRFIRYSGKNYKRNIKLGLKNTFNQEILRIKTVLERATIEGIEKILSYDIDLKLLQNYLGSNEYLRLIGRIKANRLTTKDMVSIMKASATKKIHSGAEFRFLEMLSNEFVEDTDLGKMIIDKINGKEVDEAELDEMLIGSKDGRKDDGALDRYMETIVEREMLQWESIGLFDTESIGKGKERYKYLSQFGNSEEEIRANLTEYIWNDMFATINLIQLTVTDLAYYKNMEDFQKRYAQVHSPTLKLNTEATYKGKKVSDGYTRTLYIKDNEIMSEIIPNVREIFNKKLATIGNSNKRAEMKKMVDLIVSSFEKVNVTDAQAYSSPTSYRKKMIMAGTWDDTMEQAYQRIAKGDYDIHDLGVVWQPLKPFVYSQITKSTGVRTMSEIKVPVQNKNSEYLLLIADALMRGAGKESTLGAIFDFMEESHMEVDEKGKPIKGTYRQDGIDTVQFGSTVKSGLMGVIDINNKTYKEIKEELENKAYYNKNKQSDSQNGNDRYNDQFVHTISFEDYGIQQEVPNHLVDHMQSMGSQVRILSISDITDGTMFKVNGEKNSWDKNHLIEQYQKFHADNINEAFENLKDAFGIKSKSRKERNKALSKILTDAIKKDQRYGEDLLRACSLDDKGEFIIPLCDPVQSTRIQQLINSIIKSRINKQTVQGGPVVQASVFGISDTLHIVFNDKEGNPKIPRSRRGKESDEDYQKYLNKFYEEVSKNQGSLAYMEVYMPIPSEAMEKALTKADGTLMDIQEALDNNIINEEMLKAIGYRI